jgi:hypothetical protein
MLGRFRRAGVRVGGKLWRRGRVRVRRGLLLRRAAVRVHRRRRRAARRMAKGATLGSLLLLPIGMDSDRLRRHRTVTLCVENRVRHLTDRLADRLTGRRNVVGVAATGTGLRRVRRERGPVGRTGTAMGAGHPWEHHRDRRQDQRRDHRRGRSWICVSRLCGIRRAEATAALVLRHIMRRATGGRIARPAADT